LVLRKILASIFLVSCASTKRSETSTAENLYVSPLFLKSKEYAKRESDRWYVLSAKYGLVSPNEEIEPYDLTLNRMSKAEREKWSSKTLAAILKISTPDDSITILAGSAYKEFLQPQLQSMGYSVSVPMQGLSIGNQLKWLNSRLAEYRAMADLDQLYDLLNVLEVGLGGKRLLRSCEGKTGWPARGVYFFFEPGEMRRASDTPRVVRVGTHAVSKGSVSSLWGRLRSHRGIPSGGGNHRGSIFRLHIGAAMLKNLAGESDSWGVGQAASRETKQREHWLEVKVSEYLGSMSLLWLAIEDVPSSVSDRAFIERNTIALLSNRERPLDPPSASWLGHWSTRPSIRNSGLWNIRHIDEDYDPRFLKIFEEYVNVTLGRKSPPKKSIAPKRKQLSKRRDRSNQLNLFAGDAK
jgi:hypothetical protein